MNKIFRIFAVILLMLAPIVPSLPVARAAADTCTWTGAVNSNWSNGGNWTGCDNGGVPENTDSLTFPASASNKTNTNDLVGLNLRFILFSGDGYNITGNALTMTPSSATAIQAINSSGSNTFAIDTTLVGSSLDINQGAGSGELVLSGNFNYNLTNDMSYTNYGTGNIVISGDRTGNNRNLLFYGNISLGGTATNVYNSGGSISIFNRPSPNTQFTDVNITNSGALGAAPNAPDVNVFPGTADVGLAIDVGGDYDNDINLVPGSGNFAPQLTTQSTVNLKGNLSSTSDRAFVKPQSGTLTLSGLVNLVEDLEIEMSPSTNLNKSGSSAISLSDNATLNINSLYSSYPGATINIASPFTGSSSTAVNVSGESFLELNSSSNAYDGSFSASNNAIVRPLANTALGTTVGSTTINSSAVLFLSGSYNIAENFTVSGTGRPSGSYSGGAIWSQLPLTVASTELSGTITLNGNTTFAMDDPAATTPDDELILSGPITGSGDLTLLRVQGTNATRFNFLQTSPNTYSGKTIVEGASLELNGGAQTIPNDLDINSTPTQSAVVGLASDDDIADDSVITLNDDATPGTFSTFRLFSTMFNETIGTLNGNGTVCFDNSSQTLNVGGGNTSGSFSGFLCSTGTGVGTINKLGSGNWELANGAAYESATNGPQFLIESGSIAVNANLPATTIDVDGGGTLKGTGSTGNVTLNSAGNINAGNSPGCITVGDLNMTNSSVFTQEIAGSDACSGYDRVSTSSSAQLGNATLNVVPSYQPTVGTVFTIVQADSINGIFSGLPNGAKFTSNGLEFQINYSETQVTLTFLSGTLASTGQNSTQIAIIAMSILILSLAGLGIEKLTRKPIKINA
jgi:hypothetical protein